MDYSGPAIFQAVIVAVMLFILFFVFLVGVPFRLYPQFAAAFVGQRVLMILYLAFIASVSFTLSLLLANAYLALMFG